MAALLTRKSMRPKVSTAAATKRAGMSASPIEPATVVTRPPRARSSSAVASNGSGLRPLSTTAAPRSASRRAHAFPIPCDDPETIAVFPSIPFTQRACYAGSAQLRPLAARKTHVSDNSSSERGTAVLLLTCPDQKGIVATVAEFVYRHGGNIIHAEQHTDAERGIFFQRVEFELDGLNLAPDDIEPAFASIAQRYDMQFDLRRSARRAKLAIFVSRQAHCLYDLLARWRTGELRGEVVVVVSNHPDLADVAEHFGVDYRHLP